MGERQILIAHSLYCGLLLGCIDSIEVLFKVLEGQIVDLVSVEVVVRGVDLLNRVLYISDVVTHLLNLLQRRFFPTLERVIH